MMSSVRESRMAKAEVSMRYHKSETTATIQNQTGSDGLDKSSFCDEGMGSWVMGLFLGDLMMSA